MASSFGVIVEMEVLVEDQAPPYSNVHASAIPLAMPRCRCYIMFTLCTNAFM